MTNDKGLRTKDHVLPPRPNPGPEPWPSSRPGMGTPLFLGLGALGLGIAAVWLARRRARRRQGTLRRAQARPPAVLSGSSETPMTLWAVRVRDALVARFGAAWGAMTTEEIAAEPALNARLGPERAEQLVRFLRAADRAKFAGGSAAAPHSPEWSVWVETFVAEAGAISRSNGR